MAHQNFALNFRNGASVNYWVKLITTLETYYRNMNVNSGRNLTIGIQFFQYLKNGN